MGGVYPADRAIVLKFTLELFDLLGNSPYTWPPLPYFGVANAKE